ncbi:MAG: HflK protein [Enterovirga sp.]|jgi:membrane protease subunit HflK|nr:HflK protein [Enterovirga sp.]
MPWSNQSGGGGPWGQRGGSGGPWGSGPSGGGGGGNRPPDLEDIIRRGQDRLKGIIPGGGGTGQIGGRGIGLIGLLALCIWAATGIYTVRPDEVGVNLLFGRFVGLSREGLSYNLPYPLGSYSKPNVTALRTIEIGARAVETARRIPARVGGNDESLMLTGDENIVDIDFTLQWQVDSAKVTDFVFNLQNSDGTVRVVAESAMREVVGRRNIQNILTTDRAAIEAEVMRLAQSILNQYGAGVTVIRVNLQKVDPPSQVIDAFRDVQAARQDQDRLRNEAETYASRVVPEARGEATRIIQGAEAYRERSVAEATGQASRFAQVYDEYRKAPEVIRERIFLETMERVLSGTDKIILDQNGGQGVVPYLPLGELSRRPAPAQGGQAAQPSGSAAQPGVAR